MTPLHDHLRNRIAATGPITVAEFMTDCLMHPQHGYYTQQTAFGVKGDFITAPEISQMFGELIGLSLAQSWLAQGAPENAILVELGPGRGTLMADIIRATKAVAGFSQLPVHMVEISPRLRALQSAAVDGVIHHDTLDTLPDAPIILVANEFFDALPLRQFQRGAETWNEILVGLQGDKIGFGLGPDQDVPALRHRLGDTKQGDIVEFCAPSQKVMLQISQHIARHGGSGLIVDYGDWRSQGDTVQALKDHAPTGLFDHIGTSDITAHVDFEVLFDAAAGITRSRITPQGVFLERLGLTQRAQSLAQQMSGDTLNAHIAAHRRLAHPDEMGNLFKVFGIAATPAHMPAGLEL